jgi:hypothetical protein
VSDLSLTPHEFLESMNRALGTHVMYVATVPDYGATNYAAVCRTCEFEHLQVTTRAEAEAQVAAGCPVEVLDRQSAKRRAARLQQQKAMVA